MSKNRILLTLSAGFHVGMAGGATLDWAENFKFMYAEEEDDGLKNAFTGTVEAGYRFFISRRYPKVFIDPVIHITSLGKVPRKLDSTFIHFDNNNHDMQLFLNCESRIGTVLGKGTAVYGIAGLGTTPAFRALYGVIGAGVSFRVFKNWSITGRAVYNHWFLAKAKISTLEASNSYKIEDYPELNIAKHIKITAGLELHGKDFYG